MNLIERRKALEVMLQQKLSQVQLLETQRNIVITEIVQT